MPGKKFLGLIAAVFGAGIIAGQLLNVGFWVYIIGIALVAVGFWLINKPC